MVYCVKCGTQNPDEAEHYTRCRVLLYPEGKSGHYLQAQYRRTRDECFGIPGGGVFVGLAIGIIIILFGSIWFLQQAELIPETVEIWPFVVIIFGVFLILGAVYGLRRRY